MYVLITAFLLLANVMLPSLAGPVPGNNPPAEHRDQKCPRLQRCFVDSMCCTGYCYTPTRHYDMSWCAER